MTDAALDAAPDEGEEIEEEVSEEEVARARRGWLVRTPSGACVATTCALGGGGVTRRRRREAMKGTARAARRRHAGGHAGGRDLSHAKVPAHLRAHARARARPIALGYMAEAERFRRRGSGAVREALRELEDAVAEPPPRLRARLSDGGRARAVAAHWELLPRSPRRVIIRARVRDSPPRKDHTMGGASSRSEGVRLGGHASWRERASRRAPSARRARAAFLRLERARPV